MKTENNYTTIRNPYTRSRLERRIENLEDENAKLKLCLAIVVKTLHSKDIIAAEPMLTLVESIRELPRESKGANRGYGLKVAG